MSPIHSTVHTPPITHVPTNEGTSAGVVTPRSSHSENVPSEAQSNTTESADFLKSYAGDHASEVAAPANQEHSPEAGASEASQKAAEKQQKQQRVQQLAGEIKSTQSEALKLQNPDSRKEVETHLTNAKDAGKQKQYDLSEEHLGYAKEALDKAKRAEGSQGGQNAPIRKWPEKSDAEFPHKGKHRPGINTTNVSDSAINSKIKQESSKGGAAKYNTSVASEVHKLEGSAYENGLSLSHDNGFSTVHKFGKTIGASEGELTPYIRLDGTDHGHPITQDQFNGYIKKEVDHLKQSGGDTTELSNYLNKIGENPKNFGIGS